MHGLSYRQAGVRMAQDHCDIVVDLTGWTGQTRSPALAARPAPLQMQWLGYSGTMGAPWIDYLVADRVVVPPGEESSFSEKLIRLPDSFQPNDDKRAVARATDRRQHGLPPGGFVFCSFNQAFKITSDIFPVWMRLLKAVNDSVLWLQHDARAVEPL